MAFTPQCHDCGARIYYAEEVEIGLCEICQEKRRAGEGDQDANQD